MIVARSSNNEVGKYWFIDWSYGEFSAVRVDGVYSQFRQFDTVLEALEWVIP